MPIKKRLRSKAERAAVARRLRRRVGGVVSRKSSVMKSLISRDLHHYKRYVGGGTITGAAGYNPYLQATTTSLSVLPNVADFSTLYDQYKITHWQLRFFLKIDPSAQAAATASYPRLYWCPDYDDSTIPASLNELRERAKTKVAVMYPNRPIIVNIKPAVLDQVYRGVATVSYTARWRQWIDMTNTDVPHYGLKFAIDDLTNTNYKVETEQILWFSCKGTR